SLQYVQKCIKDGKLTAEKKEKAANNRLEYIVPVSALSESEQIAWENRQRKAAGLKPIEKAAKNPPSTVRKQERRLTLDDLSEKQRNELYIWTSLITDWLRLRGEYAEEYGKCRVDEMFVAQVKLNPKYKDIEISTDILYRKLKAYKAADISGLIDKRGGSNKGSSCVPKFMLDAFLSMYLCQNQLPISRCYEYLKDWVAEHYPESVPDIPSERTFRRRADEVPLAVKMYMREGDKAFADKCLPWIERLYDDLHANDVWIADNHTFDFFTAGADGKQRRLYLTAFTDAKSGVMVGWNLNYSPSSDSTLLALRHGILRCGVPKSIYVDNGSEFLVSDIGGRGHRRRKNWNKEELPPNILSFLGIEMHNAIVRNAKAKPIERTFCTFKNQFSRAIPTFCGGTILERLESLKYKIKHGIIPEEQQIRMALDAYIDGVYNVAEYGGKERRYKGKRRIDVWNEDIRNVTFRTCDAENLSMLMKRVSKPQAVSRNGVYINYAGEKLWYRGAETVLHIGEKVYIRYDPADIRKARIYSMADDRYLWTWELDDELFVEYITEHREDIAAAEKQIAESKKMVREYARGIVESVDADKRIDIFAAMVKNAAEGQKSCVFQKPTTFVPVFSEEKIENNPELSGIQEITIMLDRINSAAGKRKG
ncbi:MAG: Mu transposase C-terminal domain-containing protein, partial [Oscillospiraceae bacterium]